MKTPRTVCIIPARGGSKRIPRKNVRLLAGKPLLAYTIDAARQSGCFDEVVVSSDDAQILDVARQFGAVADVRSPELSGDTVKAVEVVSEYLERPANAGRFDFVAMCLPTCPFRLASDVAAAMELFLLEHEMCPRLIGVTPCDFPPQLALEAKDGSHLVDMREPQAYGFSTRSQDLGALYFPNGSIYVSTVDEYLETKTFFGRPMLSYPMPAERSFDIDYPYQFAIAEHMMRAMDAEEAGQQYATIA